MSVQRVIVLTIAFVGAACSTRQPVQCAMDTDCDLAAGGTCAGGDGVLGWCAYPAGDCASGFRYPTDTGGGLAGACVDIDGPDAGVDADTTVDADAPIDAGAQGSFAVGFVSEWHIGGSPHSMTGTEWIRIANTGSAPLDLAGARVANVAISDDRFEGTATWRPQTTMLNGGYSAGRLTPAASMFIVNSGHITEPPQDNASNLVDLRLTTFPPSGTWLAVDLDITIEIANARATLAVRVINTGSSPFGEPSAGNRVSSSPIP